MNRLWPFMSWCRSLMRTRARHAQRGVQTLALTEAGPQIEDERPGSRDVRKGPPIYLRFPPGPEGRRKRMLLGLDDDES